MASARSQGGLFPTVGWGRAASIAAILWGPLPSSPP